MNPSMIASRLGERCEETKADIERELRRLRTPPHLLEDLTQEVFSELVRWLLEQRDDAEDTLQEEVGKRARKAHGRMRSGTFKWEIPGEDALDIALRAELKATPPDQEERVLVAEVFQRGGLTPEDREILWLAFFEGLSNREIAARLQKTEDATSSIKYRAIQQAAAFVGAHRGRAIERKAQSVPTAPLAGVAPATHRWSARLGAGLYGWSTAVARDGSLLLAGWLQGPTIFGGARLESRGAWPWKLWLVRVHRDQAIAKVVCLAGAAQQYGQSITLNDDGHLIVAAYFTDAIQVVGEAPVSSSRPGRMAVLLAKIAPAELGVVWARTCIMGLLDQRDHSLTTDARGNIVVACLVPEPDKEDFSLILRRFDRNGRFMKGWDYLHTGQFHGWTVTAAGSGLLVTGAYDGSINFGSGQHKRHRKQEFFVAKLGVSGECEWLHSYGGTRGQHGWSTCADELGSVSIAGYFNGTIDFGSTPLKSKSDCDVFVARLDASGKHTWSESYPGGPGGQSRRGAATRGKGASLGLSIAAGPGGSLFLAGNFDPRTSFGADPTPGADQNDISLAKLSSSGSYLWSVPAGRGADVWFGNDIAADATGGVVLSAYIQGSVTLGQQLHPANCNELDLCVVSFR